MSKVEKSVTSKRLNELIGEFTIESTDFPGDVEFGRICIELKDWRDSTKQTKKAVVKKVKIKKVKGSKKIKKTSRRKK